MKMMADMESLQFVLIEDQEAHFELMKRAITIKFPLATIHHFTDAGACLERLGDLNPDIIVADYLMQGMTGIEFLEVLQREARNIPVIMITGQGSESIAVQAMKLGAWDYLVKSSDFFKLLPGAVEKVIRQRKLRDALRESARLNDLLLDSLPHPAMLIRRDRTVLTANRIAQEMGARINDLCWRSFGCGEYIPEEHKRYLREHPGSVPTGGTKCTFCRLDEAATAGQPSSAKGISSFGRLWDKCWTPIDDEISLVYTIDVTEYKQSEQQIHTLTQQLIRAQEMERQRLAYDLHNSIGQELSTVKIGLDTLLDHQLDAPVQMVTRVSWLSKMLQGTIEALRNLAYELRPPILDELGLVRTLHEYCEDYATRHGIQVDFFPAGMDDLELDFDTRIALYRLVQESLNNVKKHAAASRVVIRLVASFPNIILRIEDNGVGFDVPDRMNAARGERRMGLQGMEQRVALLAGTMKIESRPKHGSRIRIEVPIGGKLNGTKEDYPHC
jgi:signal transduction histidine kinase